MGGSEILGISIFTKMVTRFYSHTVSHRETPLCALCNEPILFINRFLPKEMDDLFRKLVMDSKASREKNDDSNDILQMLIQTQKKHSTLCKQMNGACVWMWKRIMLHIHAAYAPLTHTRLHICTAAVPVYMQINLHLNKFLYSNHS